MVLISFYVLRVKFVVMVRLRSIFLILLFVRKIEIKVSGGIIVVIFLVRMESGLIFLIFCMMFLLVLCVGLWRV